MVGRMYMPKTGEGEDPDYLGLAAGLILSMTSSNMISSKFLSLALKVVAAPNICFFSILESLLNFY